MKSLKTVTVTLLIAFGLTGCYTQLEYSQRVKKITDEKPVREYAGNDEAGESAEYYRDEEEVYSDSEYGYEDEGDYIPVYYKDYKTANWWSSCYCNPYSSYSYGTSYYSDPWYYGYASPRYDYYNRIHYSYAGFYRPFHYSRWKWRHFGLRFHHNFFAFSLHWGSPYYHHYYWDYPFYSYSGFLYGPYWSGYYYRPYWYGHHYYGGYYKHGGSKATVRSRSYRPRSIGTNRVANNNNRSAERTRSINRSSSSTQARGVRGTGSTRVREDRGTVRQNRTRVQQPRTRGTSRVGIQKRSNTSTKERSRGTVQERSQSKSTTSGSVRSRGTQRVESNNTPQRNSSVGVSRIRIQQKSRQVIPAPRERIRVRTDRSAAESRISRQRAVQPDENSSNNGRTSFFGRVQKIFNNSIPNNSTRIRSRSNGSTVRSNNNIFRQRSRSSNTSISKPRSSNRSSVSRSTSSSSRSRGTSGRSRSSSSRSRGN